MTRLIRVLKSGNLLNRTKKTLKEQVRIDNGILRINFFIGLCMVCTHLFACIWLGMASLDDRNWLVGKLSSLIDDGENLSLEPRDDIIRKYVLSAYFCLQTMSTVGYGDVNPTNSKERIFAIVVMLFGVVVFSFISGSLSSIMLNWDEKTSVEHEKSARL